MATETTLAEPTTELAQGAKFQSHPELGDVRSTLSAASSLMSKDTSLADSLKEGLKQQQAAGGDQAAPIERQIEKKVEREEPRSGLPERENSEIKPKAAVTSIDEPKQEGSALEDFRQDFTKGRQEQFKKFHEQKAKDAQEEAGETRPDAEQTQATTTQAADPKQATAEQPVTMDEIEKELNNPALSKRHQERMRFLAAKAKQADALELKTKELETKAGNATSTEEYKRLQQEYETSSKELMQFRRKFALESDPEIKKNYDDVIAQSNEAIMGKLKEVGLSDKTLDLIKKAGGFDAFSRSKEIFYLPGRDENDHPITKPITASDLTKQWLGSIPYADSKYIEAKMIESFNLSDAKSRKIKELTSSADQYFKEQQEQLRQASESQQKAMQENAKKFKDWTDDFQSKQDWLKEKDISLIADDKEKKAAEEHNRVATEAKTLLAKASSIKSVDEMTEVVAKLMETPHLQHQMSRLQRENEALKTQIAQMGAAVRTTPRGGSSIQTHKPEPKAKSLKETMGTSALDAMKAELENLQTGKQYSSENE